MGFGVAGGTVPAIAGLIAPSVCAVEFGLHRGIALFGGEEPIGVAEMRKGIGEILWFDVAGGAGVGGVIEEAEIGAWDAKGVIMSSIDLHVVGDGHMAVDALGTGLAGGVEVVSGRIIFRGGVLMAGGTDLVAIGFESCGVGVMAIGAADAAMEHFALEEGAVFVDLVFDLAIGVVEVGLKPTEGEVVVEILVGLEVGLNEGATGVARSAGVELSGG